MADVTIDLGINARGANATIDDVSSSLNDLGNSADTASSSLDSVGNEAHGLSGRVNALGAGAIGASAAFADMGGIVESAVDLWNIGQRRADDLARAQNDVAQAALDVEQANRDMAQSQIDVNQAQLDGTQAGIDLKQALLDQKTAQKDYNDAVKEYGKKSLEAQQASIDLEQADADAKQAKIDSTQASEDLKQATLDGKQATIDAKGAQLDLNEAQRNVTSSSIMDSWFGTVSSLGSALFGLVGTFALLGTEQLATAATAVASAATTAVSWVVSWVTMAASATASAIAMAAAWLLSIWPIALVIAAVVGLVALIIIYWDQIKAYTVKVFSAVWGWLKDTWDKIVSTVRIAIGWIKTIFSAFNPLGIIIRNWGAISGWIKSQWDTVKTTVSNAVSKIGGFLSGMWGGITAGLRSALNGAIGLINRAIGGINTLISGANRVPGVSIPHVPYIPYLAEGGIVTGPTLAMIGEGRESEAVLPLSKLQGMMNMTGQGGVRIVFENREPFMDWLKNRIRVDYAGDVTNLNGNR